MLLPLKVILRNLNQLHIPLSIRNDPNKLEGEIVILSTEPILELQKKISMNLFINQCLLVPLEKLLFLLHYLQ